MKSTPEYIKRLKKDINNVFNQAEEGHWTMEAIQASLSNIKSCREWKRIPQWARMQMAGYIEGQLDRHIQLLTEYRLDDTVITTAADIQSQVWTEVDKLPLSLYYKGSIARFS